METPHKTHHNFCTPKNLTALFGAVTTTSKNTFELLTPLTMYFLLAVIPAVAMAVKYYLAPTTAQPTMEVSPAPDNEEEQRKARAMAYAKKCGVAQWDLKNKHY